jgi:hypothetical protein
MRKLFVGFLLIFVVVLSSCSSLGGGSKTDYPDEVKSGKGLSVDFNTDDRLIKSGKLQYEISLENSGKEEITLSRQNFVLSVDTTQSVFTSASVEEFYTSILENGDLILYPNQEVQAGGVLEFEPNFLENRVLPDVSLILSINYDFTTEFDSTVNLVRDNGIWKLNSDNSNQAAPVKIDKLELEINQGDNYYLIFYFNDVGQNGDLLSKNVLINIDNFNARLGTTSLSCVPSYYDGKFFTSTSDYIINSQRDDLVARCSVSITDSSSYSSKVISTFDYNYKMKFEEKITFPDN